MPVTNTDRLELLLPLRGLGFRLQFSQDTQLPPFKQIALTGFLRGLLDHPSDYEHFLVLDIPEPSRLDYPSDESFRFSLLALPGGEALLQQTRQRLEDLPFTSPIRDKRAPFRDNLRFDACFDPFSGDAWDNKHDLPTLDWSSIQEEATLWRDQTEFTLRLLAPVRLLRYKQERDGVKGERRFCRNNAHLDQALWQMRLHDALANAARGLGSSLPSRETHPQGSLQADLFWIDAEYYSTTGARKPTGGLMGKLANVADETSDQAVTILENALQNWPAAMNTWGSASGGPSVSDATAWRPTTAVPRLRGIASAGVICCPLQNRRICSPLGV